MKENYETGSCNVFRDIGVPDSDNHYVKAQLVFKIDAVMKKRKLKQIEVAELFGVRQPDVSKLLRGQFRQFPSNGYFASWWRSIMKQIARMEAAGCNPRPVVSAKGNAIYSS
jgi:predicted XRE-type DNA-binding protein